MATIHSLSDFLAHLVLLVELQAVQNAFLLIAR